jgi:hypothetical protein
MHSAHRSAQRKSELRDRSPRIGGVKGILPGNQNILYNISQKNRQFRKKKKKKSETGFKKISAFPVD